MDIIQTGIKNGQPALSEYDSKKVLKDHGIPVTEEILAKTVEEAVGAAAAIGYPVAMKACAPELMHKSESGAVKIGIRNEAELRDAYQEIIDSVSMDLDGILVQEMIQGNRELVLGLSRDPQFGPCVMFGLGGVMTEILKDNAFRVAPFDTVEALDMISEIKARAMLDEFRGQAPADMEAICRSLIALGEIGLANDGVAEIDINPMIVDPKGRVVAVDALVVLKSDKQSDKQ